MEDTGGVWVTLLCCLRMESRCRGWVILWFGFWVPFRWGWDTGLYKSFDIHTLIYIARLVFTFDICMMIPWILFGYFTSAYSYIASALLNVHYYHCGWKVLNWISLRTYDPEITSCVKSGACGCKLGIRNWGLTKGVRRVSAEMREKWWGLNEKLIKKRWLVS